MKFEEAVRYQGNTQNMDQWTKSPYILLSEDRRNGVKEAIKEMVQSISFDHQTNSMDFGDLLAIRDAAKIFYIEGLSNGIISCFGVYNMNGKSYVVNINHFTEYIEILEAQINPTINEIKDRRVYNRLMRGVI